MRDAAGIEFAGTPSSWYTIFGDVELTAPPRGGALSRCLPGGTLLIIPLGARRWRVVPGEYATLSEPGEGPVAFEELRKRTWRLAGTDFGMRETADAWLSRVGNETRHATAYRAGRVVLAGDAAHIHYPAGGQGLNLGLQDAMNLGWKLAAHVRGWAPPGLLDSYQAERYPVGQEVIKDTLAQSAFLAISTQEGLALRDRFNALLGRHPSLCRELAERLSGLAVRYGDSVRVPDLSLRGAPAPTLFGLLHRGRFVLLTREPDAGIDPHPYAGQLDLVTARIRDDHPDWTAVRAMLIRPDGHLAWALRDGDPRHLPPVTSHDHGS